jgi:hypothetical protein
MHMQSQSKAVNENNLERRIIVCCTVLHMEYAIWYYRQELTMRRDEEEKKPMVRKRTSAHVMTRADVQIRSEDGWSGRSFTVVLANSVPCHLSLEI